MLRVYLDQAHWVALSRAVFGRSGAAVHGDVVELAREGVRLGLVSFPLSATHYVETYNHRDPGGRWRLARVMGELSRFHTVAPERLLLRTEVDEALRQRFGRPHKARTYQVFGMGISHAFGELSLAPTTEWLVNQDSDNASFLWELFSLAGPLPEFIEGSEHVDMESYKQPAQDFRESEERLAALFKREGLRKDRRRDVLAAREFMDLVEATSAQRWRELASQRATSSHTARTG